MLYYMFRSPGQVATPPSAGIPPSNVVKDALNITLNACLRCETPSFGRQVFELCRALPCAVGVRTRPARQIVVLKYHWNGRVSSATATKHCLHLMAVPGDSVRRGLRWPREGMGWEGGPLLALARPKALPPPTCSACLVAKLTACKHGIHTRCKLIMALICLPKQSAASCRLSSQDGSGCGVLWP